ncbi:MAG TPA: folylpolyglutamate synthase/dihydrofolate synthase family protein [Mobilitalea sp.]|nr:folylpolyglutamate synthase/dihydrofolate synthase family protein [Mobilitalea sp.]
MTYNEALDFIEKAKKSGSILGLTNIRELMQRLNNPQDKLKIIHIAGTNGKGSTAAFITAILCAAGYRVGRFISPSVFSYREMIQISEIRHQADNTELIKDENIYTNLVNSNDKINISNTPDMIFNSGENNINDLSGNKEKGAEEPDLYTGYISEEDIQELIGIIKPVCEDMVREKLSHPTSFEIETAMAFLYMVKKGVDFMVLETGMGGRLDATNVVSRPVCSVFTSVSFDHMQYLGNTIEQIAMEKAGIMKPGSIAITCSQKPEVLSVFKRKADELNIPLIIADRGKDGNIRYNINYTDFSYTDQNITKNYKIRLLGKHQVQNAVLAVRTAKVLDSLGYNINEYAVKTGLWMAKWPGRFEKVANNPDVFIDGGHNEEAAVRLRESIEMYFTNRRLIFIIGVLADKDYSSMLRILAPLANTIITITPNNPRALPSDKLEGEAAKYCGNVFDGIDIRQALNMAYKEAKKDDIIFAFGSLSFLGDLMNEIRIRKNNNLKDTEKR